MRLNFYFPWLISRAMIIRTLCLLLLVFLSACNERTSDEPKQAGMTSKPMVLATNYPLYFFASQIAGDAMDIRMPDIEGDPAMWVPGSSDLSQMQNADLVFLNGAGYEAWLAFTTLPASLTVDTTADIQDQLIPMENTTLHQHGPEGEHSHQGMAFTTWLDPQLAIEQARVISRELSRLVPAHGEGFSERLARLEENLLALDKSLATVFSNLEGQALFFSHPVYQYLQNRYALNGRSVHWEPDTEPGLKDWVDFQNQRLDHPAELMIWEGQPSQLMIERLQQQGIRSVIFDPVANRPANGDYFTVMNTNLEQFKTE